jgi:aryl-alcohol dehydrogenase-like predicted oxidoreductase
MKQRPLGNTGLWVSEIGFGMWPLSDKGWGPLATDEEALFLIHQAHDLGCNFFDVAPQFGQGRAEILLGKALKGERRGVLVCSKFGTDTAGQRDLSPKRLEASLSASLMRLQSDVVDVLLVDGPSVGELEHGHELFEALERAKKQGKIKLYGVSVDTHAQVLAALDHTPSQVVEVRFNAFHQEAAEAFAQAARQGVGLVARNPLDSGWLSANYTAKTRFGGLRKRWNQLEIRRRADLVEKISSMEKPGTTLAQASLQFVLAHPEISCVIPGGHTPQHLDYDVSAAAFPLEKDKVELAREVYFREVKGNPLEP